MVVSPHLSLKVEQQEMTLWYEKVLHNWDTIQKLETIAYVDIALRTPSRRRAVQSRMEQLTSYSLIEM